MDDTRERVVRLEEALKHALDLTAYRLEEQDRRIAVLETRPDAVTRIMGPGAWVKIMLAAALLVGTWLSTGSLASAIKAARMVSGG